MTYFDEPYNPYNPAAEAYAAKKRAEREEKKYRAALDAISKIYAVVSLRGKTRILKETTDAEGLPCTNYLGVDDFRLELANRSIKQPYDGKRAPIADVWLRDPKRRAYNAVVFAPGREMAGVYNLWRGFSVKPSAGDCSLYKKYLLDNVCSGDGTLAKWLWCWLAQLIQRPDQPLGVALVLRGGQGRGKTLFGELFGQLLGSHYTLADQPSHVTGRFNGHLEKTLMLQVDDALLVNKDMLGRLRGLITGRTQLIERKGIDCYQAKNYIRLLITSNERWVVPSALDERRFAVLDVVDSKAQDAGMFAALIEQMQNGGSAALLDELLKTDISGVDLRHPPLTAGLAVQKIESLSAEARWWLECLMRGSQLRGGKWEPVLPREALYADYLESAQLVGVQQRAWQSQLGIVLRQLCPDLGDSQPLINVEQDRHGRPIKRQVRCYVFPTLSKARTTFEAALGGQTLDWPDAGDDTP